MIVKVFNSLMSPYIQAACDVHKAIELYMRRGVSANIRYITLGPQSIFSDLFQL